MTKNSKQVSSAQLREWAALKLEIESPLDRDTARRAFLKVLQDEELVPYEYQLEAFLGSQQPDNGEEIDAPESYLAEQRELAIEDMNEFCREFLELTPIERQQRCDDLRSAFRDSVPVRVRLARLMPLLDFDSSQIRNEPELVQQLAQFLVDFAGRTPFQQGLLRQKLRARAAEDQIAWSRAAKRLERRLPTVADVDQALIRQLRTMALDPTRELPRPKIQKLRGAKKILGETNTSWLIVVFLVVAGGAVGIMRRSSEPDSGGQPGLSNRFNLSSDKARRTKKEPDSKRPAGTQLPQNTTPSEPVGPRP